MKRIEIFTAALLSCLMAILTLAGCGSEEGSGSSSGSGAATGGVSVTSRIGVATDGTSVTSETGAIKGFCHTLGGSSPDPSKSSSIRSAGSPPSYEAAPGVKVTCDTCAGSAVTDEKGFFTISEVPSGYPCTVYFSIGDEIRTAVEIGAIKSGETAEISTEGFSVVAVPPAMKKWTYICYLASDNDLGDPASTEPYASRNVLQSMENVGSTDLVNAVALLDERYSTTKMYYAEKDLDYAAVTSPYEDYGKSLDTGDYTVLQSFVEKAVALYPAEHYILDLWNHGSGPRYLNPKEQGRTRSICSDNSTGHQISLPELKQALSNIKSATGAKVDILVLSACTMADYEMMYQVKDYADFLIASPSSLYGNMYIPNEPYDQFLTRLNGSAAAEDISPIVQAMARDTFQAHIDKMPEKPHSFIAADLRKIGSFHSRFSAFAHQCNMALPSSSATLRNLAAQTPQIGAGGDLYSFADAVRKNMSGGVASSASELADSIVPGDDNFILYSASNNSRWSSLRMLCITLSAVSNPSTYDDLTISKDCEWSDFLGGL
ncbi:MAG: clostripain-related cysteine peptidase [Vulcanimicrobiota bacterium]